MADSPLPPRGKLYIQTHGCQMNEYDSARMADVLAASDGLALTDRAEDADVILVNTCSIREKAQEKVFSQLGRWRALKQGGKPVLIGVGGCVASQEGEAIVKRAPFVDLVFGPPRSAPNSGRRRCTARRARGGSNSCASRRRPRSGTRCPRRQEPPAAGMRSR
jgi:hypothetical protein